MVISEMNRLIAEAAINSRINHARLVNGVLGTLIISTSHAQSQRICSCLIARVLALSLSRGREKKRDSKLPPSAGTCARYTL